jgi:hypothetical protein
MVVADASASGRNNKVKNSYYGIMTANTDIWHTML